ncbi:MAG: hypothetical protein DRQ55_10850 [Planctomycetota bacterium]|nr:MAG: hypothetical protein DRQ55_10850 [Planctomycetota bacterium]
MAATDHHPTTFVRALVARLVADERVQALWLEGEQDAIQWPPYATLDLHFAVPEPHLEALRGELAGLFEALDGVTDFSQQQAPLKGYAGSAVLSDGTPLSYRVERTSQVGKLPRRAVNVLIDRTGGMLMPGFSFE